MTDGSYSVNMLWPGASPVDLRMILSWLFSQEALGSKFSQHLPEFVSNFSSSVHGFTWPHLLGDQALCSASKSVTQGSCSSRDEFRCALGGKQSLLPGDV